MKSVILLPLCSIVYKYLVSVMTYRSIILRLSLGFAELNRHTTRMKIPGSVVSESFIFPHPPEIEKKLKKTKKKYLYCRMIIKLNDHRFTSASVTKRGALQEPWRLSSGLTNRGGQARSPTRTRTPTPPWAAGVARPAPGGSGP